MADGPTCAEAVKNVKLIVGEWIETARSLGRTIPQPKGRLKYA
jgi:predicted RNase H-like HicB family nuclease